MNNGCIKLTTSRVTVRFLQDDRADIGVYIISHIIIIPVRELRRTRTMLYGRYLPSPLGRSTHFIIIIITIISLRRVFIRIIYIYEYFYVLLQIYMYLL